MNEYPFYVMAKPVSSLCNMTCRYCYYNEKQPVGIMNDATLELFIRKYIESQPTPWVQFTWHGGEPSIAGINFYRKALMLQQSYANGKTIYNSLQTNGLLIDESWCRFLADEDWLVGLSIDGPQHIHDHYRCLRDGSLSFAKMMKVIEMMNKYGVKWNAMASITDYAAAHPQDFYGFFKAIDCRWLQFTPVVERRQNNRLAAADQHGIMEPYSVTPEAWGDFLIDVFEAWKKEDVGKVSVQLFEAMLANRTGLMPPVCSFAAQCGNALVMEANGEVFNCDHFVFPHHRLGNLHTDTFESMLHSDRHLRFARIKKKGLAPRCQNCQWLSLCHGECPRNRFLPKGENYLCGGYARFFQHAYPFFHEMAMRLLDRH